ncbi:hypothetical protein EGW08_015796 [Elysia chlorotica]|uniref:Arrestin C-terminal-like domain-containing protein n=1 Tax=Elysia chlorotica TaxID=188477 RepID=A0A3S1AZX0_ELYCH|nr:hypothetical protein EGW08_015796 [Elysia chlorotica]
MGKITGCSIILRNTKTGVYRPGDTIEGQVLLDVEDVVRINGVKIFLTGKALTQWHEPLKNPSQQSGLETYFNVFKWLVTESAGILPAGRNTYAFSFQLPSQGLPSSFEGQYGSVRYWLKLQVDKKFPGFDFIQYKYFTVLANVDANDPTLGKSLWYKNTKTMSKALGFGNAGKVTLRACTARKVYCPGDKIEISLEANNESTKDCGRVKAQLYQDVEFQAGTEKNYTSRPIRALVGHSLGAGKAIRWNKQKLTVEPMPPSTAERTCHIIKVTYHVLVEVEVSMGFNLCLKLLIIVGTIPLVSSPPKSGAQVSPNREDLVYNLCQQGIHAFSGSKDDFKNVKFTPQNVFVNNPVLSKPVYTEAESTTASLDASQQTSPKNLTPASSDSPTELSISVPNIQPSHPQPVVSPETPEKQTSPEASAVPEKSEGGPLPPSASSHEVPMAFAWENYISSAPEMSTAQGGGGRPVLEAPPTYEEAIAVGLPPHDSSAELGTVPFHLIENDGNGCVLLLLFPMNLSGLVQCCFRSSTGNLYLHHGQVLGFTNQLPMIPSDKETSAVMLYFPSQNASLSWLQNQTATFPDLATNWWALVAQNEFNTTGAKDLPSGGAQVSSSPHQPKTYGKLKWPAANTPERHEANRVVERVRELRNQCEHNTILSSSKVFFAWGDWSSFPYREADRCVFYVGQFDSPERYQAYRDRVAGDDVAKKVYEYFHEPMIRHALPTKDIHLFMN